MLGLQSNPREAVYFHMITSKSFRRFRKYGTVIFVLALAYWGYSVYWNSSVLWPGTYHLARPLNWYPLQLLGKEKNMQAFLNDLLYEIANKEGVHYDVVISNNNDLIPALATGTFDAVFVTIVPNTITRDRYVFSDLIYVTGPVLVVESQSTIKSLEDLQGKTIGVISGSFSAANLVKYPSVIVKNYDSIAIAFDDLQRDSIDGVIVDMQHAYAYVRGIYSGKLKIVTVPLREEGLRLVAKHDPFGEKLIATFNKGLNKSKESGEFDELLRKWNLFPTQP